MGHVNIIHLDSMDEQKSLNFLVFRQTYIHTVYVYISLEW